MSDTKDQESNLQEDGTPARGGLAYFIAVLGALLIVGIGGWAIHSYLQPEPLGKNRAEERANALRELRAGEAEAVNNVGWIDQGKGLVRLRVQDAMEMVEREWKNPAAARSNLIARVEKANPPPPPPPTSPLE